MPDGMIKTENSFTTPERTDTPFPGLVFETKEAEMTEEELVDALSDKMHAEQDKFREEILKKPPEEILRDAYSYWTREDIILAVESKFLSNEHLSALVKLDNPLSAAYQEFLDTDHDTLGPLIDSLESLAEKELRAAEQEPKRPSIREQLKAGGHSTQERTGKPPVLER